MSSDLGRRGGYVAIGGDQPLSAQALADLLPAVLARGVPFRFAAGGWSMAPFIRDGDVVTIAPLTRSARLGDVVAVRGPGGRGIVVHRVVALRRSVCTIRADNCERDDGDAPRADILGTVIRVDRGPHRVRLGLGPERAVIAVLSRRAMLQPLVVTARGLRAVARGGGGS
jgi:hypothetical protein